MKKLLVCVLVAAGLLVSQVPCSAGGIWRVESFLLPGISQVMQGRWVEAIPLFVADGIAIYCATRPVEMVSFTTSDGIKISWDNNVGIRYAGYGIWLMTGVTATIDATLFEISISLPVK